MRSRNSPPSEFDRKLVAHEHDFRTQLMLDDPVELAGRFLSNSKWQHKSNERMRKCEELLTNVMSRSGGPGKNNLLSFHSEVLMLGGGKRKHSNVRQQRQQVLQGVSPKQKRHNPITYRSPLLGSGGPQRTVASRKRPGGNQRPSSASPSPSTSTPTSRSTSRSTSASRRRRRPGSQPLQPRQHRGQRPSSATASSSNPRRQGKRRKRRPQSAASASTKAINTYVLSGTTPSKEYIRPYTAALPLKLDLPWMRIKPEKSKWRASWEPTKPLTYTPKEQLKPIVKKKKRIKKTDPNEHRVVDWARQRRALLKPLMEEKHNAASTIQNFFTAAKHVGIRDRWMSLRAGELVKRNSGAIIIQRYSRGFFTRQYLREKERQDKLYQLNLAACTIQKNWRIILSKQRTELFRKIVAMKKRHSAARIQRSFRRGKISRGVKRMVAKAGEFGKQAITKMQGLFRGKLSRRKSAKQQSFMEQMKNSAVAVQSHFRGWFGRKKKKEKTDRDGETEIETKDGNEPTKKRTGFFTRNRKKKTNKRNKKQQKNGNRR